MYIYIEIISNIYTQYNHSRPEQSPDIVLSLVCGICIQYVQCVQYVQHSINMYIYNTYINAHYDYIYINMSIPCSQGAPRCYQPGRMATGLTWAVRLGLD